MSFFNSVYYFISNWIQFIVVQSQYSKFNDIFDVDTERKLSWPPWWEPWLVHCCSLARARWNNSPEGFSRKFLQAPAYKIPLVSQRLHWNISQLASSHISLLAFVPGPAYSSAEEPCSSVYQSFHVLHGFHSQRNFHNPRVHWQHRPVCKWSHTGAHRMSTKNHKYKS